MANLSRKIVCFVVLFLVMAYTGCAVNTGSSVSEKEPDSSPKAESSQTADTEDSQSGTMELKIYTINYETQEVEDLVAYIPSDREITAEMVADTVLDGFFDYGINVKLNDVEVENNNAIINFKGESEEKGIIDEPSKKVEETLLNCISYSILDNVEQVQGIIFRIDGQAYKTDNFSFGENQVYAKK